MTQSEGGRVARRRTAPPGARTDWITRPDGTRLRVMVWPPANMDGDKRGTVILLHGWREFIEKYYETVADLLDRGYGVVTMDWRGQGLSTRLLDDRHKGHVRSFDPHVGDVAALTDRIRQDDDLTGPLTLMAHSMGGHLAVRVLHDHPGLFDRAVLLAPMIGISTGPLPASAGRFAARAACRLGLETAYAPGQSHFSEESRTRQGLRFLSSDPDRLADELAAYRANPDLILTGVTWGWLAAAYGSIDRLRAPGFAETIETPTLMVLAGRDCVVSNRDAMALVGRLPHARHAVIEDARHEILKERDAIRAVFWRLFDEFTASVSTRAISPDPHHPNCLP